MRRSTFSLLLRLVSLILIVVLFIPASANAAKSPVPFEVGGYVQSIDDPLAQQLHKAGFAWIAQSAYVSNQNPPTDMIAAAHQAGFKILLSVSDNPDNLLQSDYPDKYADYVAGLAAAGADAIEVWTEPNVKTHWPEGKVDPVSYVKLLAASFKKIKAANDKTLVISGALNPIPKALESMAGGWSDDRYFAGMAAAKASQNLDCVGVEYFTGAVSPTKNSGDPRGSDPTFYFNGVIKRATNAFKTTPICLTRLGYLSAEGIDKFPDYMAWAKSTTAAKQAQWLAEAATLSIKSGTVRLMIIYHVNLKYVPAELASGWSIIRPDGTCPACDMLSKVIPVATPAATVSVTAYK